MFTLEPHSIAIIGASAEEKKLGHYVLANILKTYKGKIFPVNPKHPELLGIKAYPSVGAIPGEIDMAVVVTPASTVVALAEECGKKKVKTLVVISAGFGELGTDEGKKMEEELVKACEKHGMRLVGPNCLGVLRPPVGLNASFAIDLPPVGPVALVSQSGAMAVALMDASSQFQLGYSLVASIGNKADMDECDFLEVCADDAKTAVIGMYLENIKDGRHFMELAMRINKTKPIVLLKSGVSRRGSKAVSSHTGALAGSSGTIDALCAQVGIHRAHSAGEFLDLLRTLSTQPALPTPRIAVITNAGGPGILATDAAERESLTLVDLSEKTKTALRGKLPPAASVANPVDVLGDALADRYGAALKLCAQDESVDGIVAVLTPQVMTPCLPIARAVTKIRAKFPLIPIVTAFMGHDGIKSAVKHLQKNGVPNFSTPEDAVHAMATLRARRQIPDALPPEGAKDDDRTSAAHQLIKARHGLLSEALTEELFSLYGLPVPQQAVAKSAEEAAEMAESIGLPVVAKISSPDIVHKTDIGGVKANLKTMDEVKKAYTDILANCAKHAPASGVNGVLIQKFLPAGNEFIVGAVRDPSFGPLVMVGLGGIYTELFRDTSFRIAPVTQEQAFGMLQELKSWSVLLGMRGKKASDIAALAQTVTTISALVADCPAIKELDLNPVLVSENGIVIADAKVIID